MFKTNFKSLSAIAYILLIAFLGVFLFCILTEPIYSPDTYSYLRAMPYRQMGYVIFLKVFTTLFGSYYDIAVVAAHAAFSLFGVHYFFRRVLKLFQLHLVLQLLLLVILLFPFFPPLSIANNLCSEGLGYGLYLIFIALGLDILINKKNQNFKYYLIAYLALVSVRSQFIFSTLIFAGTYFLMYRKEIFRRKHIITLSLFCGVLVVASITERSYHKVKDGFYKPTPLGYTSAATAPIYLSGKTDYELIENKEYQEILKKSYDSLSQIGLLVKPEYTSKEAYKVFHDNLPVICNQTVREIGKAYYSNKHLPKEWKVNQINSYIFFETEAACKEFTKVLILNNFKEWLKLFYANINYGFKSQILLWFVVFMFLLSFIKTVVNYKKQYAIIFLLSSLILSNALFIAFAVHSIQRYLFYNYALIFLLLFSTYNLIKRGQKP
jgi:O-antigen ligase